MILTGLNVNKESILSDEQKDKSRVLITKQGGKYFWATRENKEFFPVVSGIYIFYISPGAGYVKINTVTNEYFEHMSLGLNTFTYWGNAEKLNLK